MLPTEYSCHVSEIRFFYGNAIPKYNYGFTPCHTSHPLYLEALSTGRHKKLLYLLYLLSESCEFSPLRSQYAIITCPGIA